MTNEQVVFRNIAFPISAFDYLKAFQRTYYQKHRISLTNNQTLAIILKEHQLHIEESEEHESSRNKTAS